MKQFVRVAISLCLIVGSYLAFNALAHELLGYPGIGAVLVELAKGPEKYWYLLGFAAALLLPLAAGVNLSFRGSVLTKSRLAYAVLGCLAALAVYLILTLPGAQFVLILDALPVGDFYLSSFITAAVLVGVTIGALMRLGQRPAQV